jgi:hypothetical protein
MTRFAGCLLLKHNGHAEFSSDRHDPPGAGIIPNSPGIERICVPVAIIVAPRVSVPQASPSDEGAHRAPVVAQSSSEHPGSSSVLVHQGRTPP